MKKRKMDGCFFRIQRGDKWENVCFTDLTPEEREEVTKDWEGYQWKTMAMYMADLLRGFGDAFDISFDETVSLEEFYED